MQFPGAWCTPIIFPFLMHRRYDMLFCTGPCYCVILKWYLGVKMNACRIEKKIKSNHMNNILVWIHCFVTWEENIFLHNRVNLVVLKSEYSGRTWPIQLIDCIGLTHWGRDKMADILHTIFKIQFHQWKCLYFDSNFIAICSQWSC